MISVSDRSRMAVLALAELAGRRGTAPVSVLEVAECRGIPPHQVEQVFSALRRAGLLQSQRGVKGGYTMRRDPSEVTVLEIIEAVDGPIGGSADVGVCPVSEVWAEGAARLADAFRDVSVADVAEREARCADAPMFHI